MRLLGQFFSSFSKYLFSRLPKSIILLLTLSGIMLESSFTARQHIEVTDLGDPWSLSCLYDWMKIDPVIYIPWSLSYY